MSSWMMGSVDRSRPHIELRSGERSESLAVLGDQRPHLVADFSQSPTAAAVSRDVLAEVVRQLDFYLDQKGEPDPWAYALHHCSTAANAYSPVVWCVIEPTVNSGSRVAHDLDAKPTLGSRSWRDGVADFWDEVIAAWSRGDHPHEHEPLRTWFSGYRGTGRGAVTVDASPEPYIGPLATRHGQPRLVTLGLNPGAADLDFQGRSGKFADEMKRFSDWAVTAPYLRDPWTEIHPQNRYHESLLRFARRWLGDSTVRSEDILVLEMFPWHSERVTAAMRPDPSVIERFIWQPLSEIEVGEVFAFGAPWRRLAQDLDLQRISSDIQLAVESRQVETFRLPSQQQLIVSWQAGYSGPPGAADATAIKKSLQPPT